MNQSTKATFREIFGRPIYIVATASTSLIFLSFSLWLSNLSLLRTILASPRLTLLEKTAFFFNILGTLKMSPNPLSSLTTIATALLLGINLSLFLFYLRRKREASGSLNGLGLSGFLLGILGVGCASCGSVIFSVLGLTTLASLLPLKGVEFNLIASLLLLISTGKLIRLIQSGNLCPTTTQK